MSTAKGEKEKSKRQLLERKQEDTRASREKLESELRKLEAQIEELRVLYEQHFIDVLPNPPDKLRKEVVRKIRVLLKAPFKNSQTRFQLRTLVTRYQTYATYWERVVKEREEGKYVRDVFKAEMREKLSEDARRDASRAGAAEKGLKQLYATYEDAMRKAGIKTDNLNFDAFRKTLMDRAKQLKASHGMQKLQYKVVVKEGKVLIKASTKE